MQSTKQRLIFAIFVAGAGVILYLAYTAYASYREGNRIDQLTFSSTQTWNEEVYAQKENFTPFLGREMFKVTLPEPPTNRSEETAQELHYLHELADARTAVAQAEIEEELKLETTRFNGQTYQTLLAGKFRTQQLIQTVLPEFSAMVLAQKEHFDRVRPSILDQTLTTAIEIPGHPAYPSGHASQSMLIGLILGELDPEHAETYTEDAVRIAHNREIAGVHYPSDSRVGRELANMYFDLLKAHEPFQEMLESARPEWQ